MRAVLRAMYFKVLYVLAIIFWIVIAPLYVAVAALMRMVALAYEAVMETIHWDYDKDEDSD